MGNALICPRLFEMGILKASIAIREEQGPGTHNIITNATVTPLGYEVLRMLASQLGVVAPFDMHKAVPPSEPENTTVFTT